MNEGVIKFPKRGKEYRAGFSAGYREGKREVQAEWDNEKKRMSNGTILLDEGKYSCARCGHEVKDPKRYCPTCGVEWNWIEIYEQGWRETEVIMPRDVYYPSRELYVDWLDANGRYDEKNEVYFARR